MGREEERAMLGPEELARKKKIKIITYVVIFIVFQMIVFAVLGTTVLKVKRPRIKIRSVIIENFNTSNTSTPSFEMKLITLVSVRNKNWGEYKFRNSTLTLSYNGEQVGEAEIPSRKAKLRGTRNMNVTIDVNSAQLSVNTLNSNLTRDLISGNLTFNAYTKLDGKVTLMLMMKKNKSVQMNCTMIINVLSQATAHDIICK